MASVEEIEEINILNAAMLAMKRAVSQLSVRPDMILVDGNKVFESDINIKSIIKETICMLINGNNIESV